MVGAMGRTEVSSDKRRHHMLVEARPGRPGLESSLGPQRRWVITYCPVVFHCKLGSFSAQGGLMTRLPWFCP